MFNNVFKQSIFIAINHLIVNGFPEFLQLRLPNPQYQPLADYYLGLCWQLWHSVVRRSDSELPTLNQANELLIGHGSGEGV